MNVKTTILSTQLSFIFEQFFRIEMKDLRTLLLLIFATFQLFASAQDVEFIGTGKQVVETGERFRVVYEVNAEGQNFRSPNFGNLNVLSGPNTSTSSSVQIINGNMQQSYNMSYTFIVEATSEGEITIPPASVTVKGKVYNSNSIKISVVKNAAGSSQSTGGSQNQASETGTLQSNDVYMKAIVDNTNPYQGEQIIVTYRIYTRVPIANISMKKSPSFQGFWSKNLMEDNSQLKQSTQVINGEEYIVADISKFALFPQKSGELNIESLEMDCVAQIKIKTTKKTRSNDPFESFFNDPFFNRDMKNVQTTLASKQVTINVKPLPQVGKPESFTGAVGDFTFKSELDKSSLTTNDALTLSVTISGNGNIELVDLPKLALPTDFEAYDPKVTSNVKVGANGVSGSKKFEFLAIPRAAGDFDIKPLQFSYFNPSDREYHTFSTGQLAIHVEKGDGSSTGVTYSSSAQEDIRFIGRDIHHIKNVDFNLKPAGVFFFASASYYFFIIFPIVLLIAFILYWRWQEKRNSNVSLLKTRKANKVAKTRLMKADGFRKQNNDKAFYDEIAQALWGYIVDKFNISQANLSVDTVKETLQKLNVEDSVTDNFVNTLNNIEFARFAPGDTSGKMETVYNEAMNAITSAEKALK